MHDPLAERRTERANGAAGQPRRGILQKVGKLHIRAIEPLHRPDPERHVGPEVRRRHLLHVVAAGNDGGEHIGIEQGLPYVGRRGMDIRRTAAVQIATSLGERRSRTCCGRRCGLAYPQRGHDLRGRQRQIDVLDIERVGDGVGNAHRRAHAIALADALGAERRERRWRFHMQDEGRRHLHRGGRQVVRERAGEEAAVTIVGIFFVERRADGVRKATGDLARDHPGMQDTPAVVHRDVFVDAHGSRHVVDLDAAHIEYEAVAERGVNLVGLRRRREFRGRPEGGFSDRCRFRARQRGRRPVARGREPCKRDAVAGIAARPHLPVEELDILRAHVELAGRDHGQTLAQPLGCDLAGAAHRSGEAARVVA